MAKKKPAAKKKWSQRVTQRSNALDLESGVFSQTSPRKIALSLKRSAEHSRRRKSEPFRSAMSMLNFYINRAGRKLPKNRKAVLQRAKDELRAPLRQMTYLGGPEGPPLHCERPRSDT